MMGNTPLHYAARNDHTGVAEYLLKTGKVNANCTNKKRETPLDTALKKAGAPRKE